MLFTYFRSKYPADLLDPYLLSLYPSAAVTPAAERRDLSEDKADLEELVGMAKSGDTIIFETLLQLSTSKDEAECARRCLELIDRNVGILFLKQPFLDTGLYDAVMNRSIVENNSFAPSLGFQQCLPALIREQVHVFFVQEAFEHELRGALTREGMVKARSKRKQIGRVSGCTMKSKKEAPAKSMIRQFSKDFGGDLNDTQVIKKAQISRPTFYKYKKELMLEYGQMSIIDFPEYMPD